MSDISLVNDVGRIMILLEEIAIMQTEADSMESGAGNLYTTINTLRNRVRKIREKLNASTK